MANKLLFTISVIAILLIIVLILILISNTNTSAKNNENNIDEAYNYTSLLKLKIYQYYKNN